MHHLAAVHDQAARGQIERNLDALLDQSTESDPSPTTERSDPTSFSTTTGARPSVGWSLADERFLILPQPTVLEYLRRKVADYDRWLRGMRRLKQRHEPSGDR